MFNKLISSGPKRRSFWNAGTVSISVAVHSLVLAGAVYASSQVRAEVEEIEEEVTFLEIEEAEPEPPAPEPEPPPPAVEAPPPPQGFQELIPPINPPAVIPDIQESLPPVNLADFSGLGVAGGTAAGVEGGTPQNVARDSTFAYEVAVLDAPPRVANMSQVQRAMTRLYPRLLLQSGISGSVTLRFVVEPNGTVDTSSIQVIDATNEQFAAASKAAIEEFRFDPGKYQGESVRVLIQMPISWQADS